MISPKDTVKEVSETILGFLGVSADVSLEQKENSIEVIISGTKDSGILIGYRGETLKALQHIIRLLVFSKLGEETPAIIVDVEGYRKQEEEKLKVYVQKMAELVKKTGQEETLSPMSSYKRRLIHTYVSEINGVKTESQGEGQDRRIIISPEK